ncbi:putative glycerol-3-phosphate acyltransferase 3 [Ananas comosus]|uniref:Putative glycerol-3-phosphate acyltransferase 3 n=1 Tax=Ananas comosus TaxID=4615 RepID=A0A199VK14_ANACO|nr:putative glycerol-3-phosphate acyltransferase 3 [Ananas comosus]
MPPQKAFSKSLLYFHRFLRRRLTNPFAHHHRKNAHVNHPKPQKCPPPPLDHLADKTVLLDVDGALLRSPSAFPYFMLVALEAGSFLRGLLLLCIYPLLLLLNYELGTRIMVFVCFVGIRADKFRLGSAVLHKFFLEDVGMEGFEVLRRGERRVCVSRLPRVMVEGFLEEYLGVEVVVGREIKVVGGYFVGLMEKEREVEENSELKRIMLLGDHEQQQEESGGGVVGYFGCSHQDPHRKLFSHCKSIYWVNEAEKRNWHVLPREQYTKPLVFHDGRLAFRPTPMATLTMFLWLPLGIPLSVFRTLVFLLLPYPLSIPIGAFSGMRARLIAPSPAADDDFGGRSHLYVCNHRTLLDPIYISAALNKHVTAVTYSVSRISEALSPIRTVPLTRNKEEGDLVVCPEGTTCREPYLLRFSPLFTELAEEIIPVALITRVGMFYGTSTSGFKFLDPFYFLMNPRPEYAVEFLKKIDTCHVEGRSSSIEVANHIQREIGNALGFKVTTLTRKDKYNVLAGNDGFVEAKSKKQ